MYVFGVTWRDHPWPSDYDGIVKLSQAQAAIQEKSQMASQKILELVAEDQKVSPARPSHDVTVACKSAYSSLFICFHYYAMFPIRNLLVQSINAWKRYKTLSGELCLRLRNRVSPYCIVHLISSLIYRIVDRDADLLDLLKFRNR